jgi:uncharacterized protein involved in tolerance to divalent cations
MAALLVFTNLPDRAAAERVADLLIQKRLAACVNILAPCRSVYRWKGAVQSSSVRCARPTRTNFRRLSLSLSSAALLRTWIG